MIKITGLVTTLLLSSCSLTTNKLDQTPEKNATVVVAVKAALIREADVDAAAIQLNIVAGQLQLDGFVGSEEESQLAYDIASDEADGMSVINLLEVR